VTVNNAIGIARSSKEGNENCQLERGAPAWPMCVWGGIWHVLQHAQRGFMRLGVAKRVDAGWFRQYPASYCLGGLYSCCSRLAKVSVFCLLVTSGGESGAHEKFSENEALRQPQDREFGFRRKSPWDSGLAAMAIGGFAIVV